MGNIRRIKTNGLFFGSFFLLMLFLTVSVINSRAKAFQNEDTASYATSVTLNNSSQNDAKIKINLDLHDVKLSEALLKVAKKANVSLSFDRDIIPQKTISYHSHKKALYDVLNDLLTGTNLTFAISADRKTIIIHKKFHKVRQLQTVNGTVTNAQTGDSMIGVNILVVGTSRGTVTSTDGHYSLNVPSLQDTLRFSFIGFKTKAVPINGRTMIDVSMEPTVISTGNELVVVGFGTQKKKNLTGTISTINSTQLAQGAVANVGEALEGKATGVRIISSGTPGSGVSIRVRGISTIGNSAPLFVIDGFPTKSGLNQINPNDIESINVLKGAAAEAIYGSRGANGVIIVTTKSGSNRGNKLTINVYRGYQKATNMIHMLNASQYAKLSNQMLKNNGLPTNPNFSNPSSLGKGTNWLSHLFRTAPMQNYSVSYSGGNNKTTYYVSGNILHQKGIIKSTGYNRYSIQMNMHTKLKKWLDIGENLTLEHDIKPHGSYNIQNTLAALPTQSVFDNKGNYTSPMGRSDWVGVTKNPIAMTQLINSNTKGSNILGTIFGKINITGNLSVKSKLGINAKFWDSRTWSPKNDLTPQPQLHSQLSQQFNKSISWLIDNTLTYNRSFKRSKVKLLLGMTAHNSRLNFMNGSIQGFPSDRTQQFTNGLNNPTVGGNASSWSLLSYFGRIHYSYNGTYLTTLSLRRDGSSRFGSDNKWGWFPALSVAWRISNEKFFRDVKFINDLKLHFGYGVTGNQDIGNYSFASALQTLKYSFNGTLVSTVVPNVMPNPDVHWESVEQYDLGLETKLLNDRIEFNVDVYIKNTDGMLVPESIPITTGYSDIDVPSINAGKMRNKGLELSVSSQNFRGSFSWNSRFNISFNKNKIVSLNDTIPIPRGSLNGLLNYSNISRLQAGHPMNEFYGFVTDGIFQTQQQVKTHATQQSGSNPFSRTSPGDIRFVDLNHDGVINGKDRTFIGNPNPDFIYSLYNSFSYKNFGLSIFLQGVYGNKIFNGNRVFNTGMSIAKNQSTRVLRRWTGPGTSNTVPRAVFNDPNDNTRDSNRYIENGSYLRIKNVTLKYNFPNKLIQNIHVSSLRIYATVRNLYTFTKYTGFDPEVGINGIDNNVYPVARTITMGIRISL